jgi:hypothetical protein
MAKAAITEYTSLAFQRECLVNPRSLFPCDVILIHRAGDYKN